MEDCVVELTRSMSMRVQQILMDCFCTTQCSYCQLASSYGIKWLLYNSIIKSCLEKIIYWQQVQQYTKSQLNSAASISQREYLWTRHQQINILMQIHIPEAPALISKAGRAITSTTKKNSLDYLLLPRPPIQVTKRHSVKVEPFQKMLPRASIVQPFEGADKIYDVNSRKQKCKGFVELCKMGDRKTQKVDPQFRVYIDPLKSYQLNKSAVGLLEMDRQTKRNDKHLIHQSSYIDSPQKYQSIPSQVPTKLPNISFNKMTDREYYYKQQQVRDCYYNPNFQYVRKGLNKVGMPFVKQTFRKEIKNPSNSQVDCQAFDYQHGKYVIYPRHQPLIDFKKMKGREKKEKVQLDLSLK